MARLKFDNISSFGSSNPITFADGTTTTGNFAGATTIPNIAAGDYLPMTVQQDTPSAEIVYLQGPYTAGASSATTFLRAQEGTSGVAHAATPWVSAPTALDFILGLEITRSFDIAYDTPGLDTGYAVYTPQVGEILLDAWWEIDTAYDGTTPLGDVGQYLVGDGDLGWFGFGLGLFADMTVADDTGWYGTGLLSAGEVSYSSGWNGSLLGLGPITATLIGVGTGIPATNILLPPNVTFGVGAPSSTPSGSVQAMYVNVTTGTVYQYYSGSWSPASSDAIELTFGTLPTTFFSQRPVPAKFTTADPVLAVVSQTGSKGGGSPGATQGAATLYLKTLIPG